MDNPYVRKFVGAFASENIIGLFSRYNRSFKEITESWAMLEAAWNNLERLDDFTVIVIGDGGSPRTASLFAYFSKAHAVSVDPDMNLNHWEEHKDKQTRMGYPPQRLEVHKSLIQDLEIDCGGRNVLLIWPHSHAPMGEERIKNHKGVWRINMPCCRAIPAPYYHIPHIIWDDPHVRSPKQTVHFWTPYQMGDHEIHKSNT